MTQAENSLCSIPDDYQPVPDLLNGRVIIVTGAASGIGKAVSKSLAAYGATVILLDKAKAALEKVYDEIEQAAYPLPVMCPLDLENATPQHYEEFANFLMQEFGRLDGLLHNAALLGRLTPIEQYDIKLWYRVMQVNLNAAFLLTQACLPLLKRSQSASVVFTTDKVGRKARAYWGAYGVSKFALEGLMQILADELDQGENIIRINSIDPGPVYTHFFTQTYPGVVPEHVPLPDSIVGAYLYLLGAESLGVTGRAFVAQSQEVSFG